jgi:hypothetical protein
LLRFRIRSALQTIQKLTQRPLGCVHTQISADDQRQRLARSLDELETVKAEQKNLGAAQAAAEAKVAAGKNLPAQIEEIVRSGANATGELERLQSEYRDALAARAELEQIGAQGRSSSQHYQFLLSEIRETALAILTAEGFERIQKVALARQRYIAEWSELFALVKCLDFDIKNLERMPAERANCDIGRSPVLRQPSSFSPALTSVACKRNPNLGFRCSSGCGGCCSARQEL